MEEPTPCPIPYSVFPREISIMILLRIKSLATLSQMCRTSKEIWGVGKSNYFWRLKYQQDYGSISNGKKNFPSWKDRYKRKYERNWRINTPVSTKHGTIGRISNGYLYMWGRGNKGQLGNGFKNNSTVPIHIPFNRRVISISCGKGFTGAITVNGLVYIWGRNDNYQLGLGNVKSISKPKNIKIDGLAKKISCGEDCAAVMTRNGNGYIWGTLNVQGNTTEYGLYKRPVLLKSKVKDISAGYRTIFLVDSKFRVYQTRPDIGVSNIKENPEKCLRLYLLHTPKPIKYIQASFEILNALTKNGLVYQMNICKGYVFLTSRPRGHPLYDDELPPVSKISTSWSSKSRTIVITKDDRLFVWGENRRKNMPGLPRFIETPTEITMGSRAKYISVSERFVCVISDDDYINCWQ